MMKGSIYSNDYIYLTNQLKKARKEAKLTQREVAEHLGHSQSYVSKAEIGQLKLDILELRAFANLYKKNLDFFIGE